MRVDEVFVVQILANILDNAVKYAGPTPAIRITADTEGDRVRLTIEDGGPGVPPEALPRLFEKFYRVPRKGEGSRRGTGIGLSVVRGLAEAMGATVVARPSDMGGLAVDLSLAGRRARHYPRIPVTGPDQPAEGAASILIVEDDAATRGAVATFLRGHGHRVAEAGDAETATAAWSAQRPDIILLDLGLPDRDGLALIRQVRREATTPILVISARGREEDKIAALDLGADDYVTKPFGMGELRARIAALLRRMGGPVAEADGEIRIGHLVLDPARRLVAVGDRPVHLTPREYEVLKTLMLHAGRLVTHGRLLRAVWGTAYSEESHYIHVYVSQIRRKLEAADDTGSMRGLIVAEPGVGYRIRSS